MRLTRSLTLALCLLMLTALGIAAADCECGIEFLRVESMEVYDVQGFDAEYHWGMAHVAFKCNSCGGKSETQDVRYVEHTFSGGTCKICGYSSGSTSSQECTHENAKTEEGPIHYDRCYDDKQDWAYCVNPIRVYCPDCGYEEEYSETWTEQYQPHSFSKGQCLRCGCCEQHSFSDGECTRCGYRAQTTACDHTTKEKVIDTDIERRELDDTHHDVIRTYRIACECGQVSSEETRRETVDCSFEGETSSKHEAAGHRTYGKCDCGNESNSSYKAFLSTCSVCQEKGLGKGSKGDRVRELQTMLTALGLYNIAIDGDYGRGTQAAVDAFFGRSVEYLDDSMLQQIRNAYSAIQNPPPQTEAETELNINPDWSAPYTTICSQGDRNPDYGTVIDAAVLGKVLNVQNVTGGWFRMWVPDDGDYVIIIYAPNVTRPTFSMVLSVEGEYYASLQYDNSGEAQSQVVQGLKKGQIITWRYDDDSGDGGTLLDPFQMVIVPAGQDDVIPESGNNEIENPPQTVTEADWDNSSVTLTSKVGTAYDYGLTVDSDLMGKVLNIRDVVGGGFQMIAPADGDYVFWVIAPDITRPTFTIEVSLDGVNYASLQYVRSSEIQSRIVRGVKKGQIISWWNNDDSGRYWTLQVPFKLMITLAAGTTEGTLPEDALPEEVLPEDALPEEELPPLEEIEWKYTVSGSGGSVVLNIEPVSGTPTGEYMLAMMPQTYGVTGKVTYYEIPEYLLTEANGYRRGYRLDTDLHLKRGNVYYFAVVPKNRPDAIGYSFEYAYDITARILTPSEGDEIDLFTSGSMFVTWGPTEGASGYEVRIMEKVNGSLKQVCAKKVDAFEGALVMATKITLADVQRFYSQADMSRDHNIQIQVSALME